MSRVKLNAVFVVALGSMMVAATPLAALGPEVTGDGAAVSPNGAVLHVDNRNELDIDVFVETEAGDRYRLGMVRGGCERDFELPTAMVESMVPFRVKVYTLDSEDQMGYRRSQLEGVKTSLITVAEEETVTLVVERPITLSFIPRKP